MGKGDEEGSLYGPTVPFELSESFYRKVEREASGHSSFLRHREVD